jgi:hypothetical protein
VLAHAGGADESLSVVLLFAGIWVGWAGWSRLRGTGFPRLPAGLAYTLVAAGVVLAVSAAIVPRKIWPKGVATVSPAAVRPASTATIAIVKPTEDQVVTGPTLDVVMTLDGGTIVDTASTKLTPTTGHIHLTLDGTLVSMTYGLVQELSLQGLAPGRHTLEAEFVAADHGPFEPRVTSTVVFRTIATASGSPSP